MDNETTEDVGLTDFDLAFEAAAGLGDGAEGTAKGEGTADSGASEGEGTAAAEGTADDAATKEAADKAAQEAVDTAAKEEADKASADAEAQRVADEAAAKAPKTPVVDEAAVAARAEADRAAKEAADKAVAEAAAKEQFTDADQEVLARTAEDFPDVAKAFEIRERVLLAKIENLLSGKLGQLTSQFDQRLAPALSVAQTVARNAHEAEILGKHPDAFTVLPQVEAWVSAQPKIVQNVYNAVLDKGSAAEIVELYDVFKKATVVEGAHSGNTAKLEADNAAKAAAEADREKKLKAQEGVRSRQTAQKSSIDENDFEGAFALAANS